MTVQRNSHKMIAVFASILTLGLASGCISTTQPPPDLLALPTFGATLYRTPINWYALFETRKAGAINPVLGVSIEILGPDAGRGRAVASFALPSDIPPKVTNHEQFLRGYAAGATLCRLEILTCCDVLTECCESWLDGWDAGWKANHREFTDRSTAK